MKIHHTLDQGSEQWLCLRAGKITASRAKDATDFLKSGKPSQKQSSYAAQVAVERIAGRPIDQQFETWQMRAGRAQEPLACQAYESHTGSLVEPVGAISTDDDVFLYSPDGLIDDDGLLEIKTLCSAERIFSVVGEKDVSEFMDQCMFGLWLTGRQWIDLCIWSPALEPIGLQMVIKRIERDEAAIEKLESDLMAFALTVRTYESALRKAAAANKETEAA